MYLLFRDKGWTPAQYWAMSPGERVLARAFYLKERADRRRR